MHCADALASQSRSGLYNHTVQPEGQCREPPSLTASVQSHLVSAKRDPPSRGTKTLRKVGAKRAVWTTALLVGGGVGKSLRQQYLNPQFCLESRRCQDGEEQAGSAPS